MILGMHFGHDANLCILKNGEIQSYCQIERVSNIKHSGGIGSDQIVNFINDNKISVDCIKLITITSTQSIDIVQDNPKIFSFEYLIKNEKNIFFGNLLQIYLYLLKNKANISAYKTEEFKHYKNIISRINHQSTLTNYLGFRYNSIKDKFFVEIKCKLLGKKIKGFYVSHHLSHAASTYYKSKYNNSKILTNDGGLKEAGLFCNGKNNKIKIIGNILTPWGSEYAHFANLANVFDSGKLMGLSAYSKIVNYKNKFNLDIKIYEKKKLDIDFFIKNLNSFNFIDLNFNNFHKSKFNNFNNQFKLNSRIASLAQFLFQKRILNFLKKNIIKNENLCLSGGSFLNCPTNTLIHQFITKNLFIESSPNDEGLSFGSAAYIYFSVLDNKISQKNRKKNAKIFHGQKVQNVKLALDSAKKNEKILITEYRNIRKACYKISELLLKNFKGAIIYGRGELGPRALGHRSIISLATKDEDRNLINLIKNRELWRPLAPAVLDEDFKKFFLGPKNKFMLFTNKVCTKKIPAAEHIDQSARVQVVGQESICFKNILNFIKLKSKIPVILNTSFNDKNVPMYDRADEAYKFFIKSKLNFILIDKYLLIKK